MRIAPILTALTFLAGALAWTESAHAQPMGDEQKRAGARALFNQGYELKQSGRCSEALEKLQAAQRLFEAPTTLLNVAECQASLGKLVEASESYRLLGRMQEKADWSPQFVAAKKQGEAELAQIEPRIPTLTIDIDPRNAPGLQLQFDGAPLDSAFVGVPRPVNPGDHRVGVSAQGFAYVEQAATLREREPKRLPFRLVPISHTGTAPPPGTPLGNAPGTTAPGSQPGNPPPYIPPPPPGSGTFNTVQPAPAPRTTNGFVYGGHLGAVAPLGSATETELGAGPSVGALGGFRFSKHQLGIDVELNYLSGKQNSDVDSAVNVMAGASYTFLGAPEANGIVLKGGIGVNATSVTGKISNSGGSLTPFSPGGGGSSFYFDGGYGWTLGRDYRLSLLGLIHHNNSGDLSYTLLGLGLRLEHDQKL